MYGTVKTKSPMSDETYESEIMKSGGAQRVRCPKECSAQRCQGVVSLTVQCFEIVPHARLVQRQRDNTSKHKRINDGNGNNENITQTKKNRRAIAATTANAKNIIM